MTDLVSRQAWGADNVKLDPMPKVPVDTVFLHHTATPASLDGAKDMRNIEAGEQAQGYSTIAYTECGHPDGKVYEGRGVKHLGAATKAWNAKSLAYCFIGNYQTLMPSTVALESCAQRLARWAREGAITKDFVLRPHSDVFATACCGSNLKPHIPGIRQRVKDILEGGVMPPQLGESKILGVNDLGDGLASVWGQIACNVQGCGLWRFSLDGWPSIIPNGSPVFRGAPADTHGMKFPLFSVTPGTAELSVDVEGSSLVVTLTGAPSAAVFQLWVPIAKGK